MAMRITLMALALTIAALPRGAFAQADPGQADPGQADPGQADPACAKYQEPLAYNACLASHGPKANDVGVSHAQDEFGHGAPAPSAAASSGSRVERWSPSATRRHGRVHMEFRLR
jgi:hypothetical protein